MLRHGNFTLDFSTTHTMKTYVLNRSICSLLALIPLLGFTYLETVYHLIPRFNEIFSLTPKSTNLNHLELVWVPIIAYILIATIVYLLLKIFKKLEGFNRECVIWGLTWGLIIGIIAGLIWGLTSGLIGSVNGDLIGNIILNIILDLIVGLILSLIIGLIIGLKHEFEL